MALDRQSIERKDFPIGRRGYDPDAVDTHLRTVSEEVEDLKRANRRRTETLAVAASEQVRVIVEAAETSAAEIRRQAEDEAQEIRSDAKSEAQSTREEATTQAREYVANVSESTATMLQRLEAMENELGGLIESLKTGSNRLNADLQLLVSNLDEVKDAVGPRPRFEPEPASQTYAAAPLEESEPEYADEGAYGQAEPHEGEGGYEGNGSQAAEAPYEVAGGTPAEEAEQGPEDTEGARLIALNMALNGTPREETDRYLAENFQLSDRGRLLDEVYASVEG